MIKAQREAELQTKIGMRISEFGVRLYAIGVRECAIGVRALAIGMRISANEGEQGTRTVILKNARINTPPDSTSTLPK